MSMQQAIVTAKPQLIPTNEGGRTFAAPPAALQNQITPNELFYIRNHWREPPRLDAATYRLGVEGEVTQRLSLSLPEILELPKRRMQVTLECCGNSPVPEYWAKQMRQVMEKVTGHGIMSNAEWGGVPLATVLERAGLKRTAKDVVFSVMALDTEGDLPVPLAALIAGTLLCGRGAVPSRAAMAKLGRYSCGSSQTHYADLLAAIVRRLPEAVAAMDTGGIDPAAAARLAGELRRRDEIIAELRREVRELAGRQEQVRRYALALHEQVRELQAGEEAAAG